MSFVVTVETAHMDRGAVINSHSKQAAKRPNKLLKGHRTCIAETKQQTDNQDQPMTKRSKSTHLTPMREGGAFGDLQRITRRTGSLGLVP
jgi:hypothetical protein